jgi:Transcriptional regulator/sugar kinase
MTSEITQFLTHQNAAALNRNAILNYIKNNAPISRTDIWEKMGLSRASVTQIIKQLIDQGFVYETGTGESRGGRKPCFLEFNANARNILAFDWHMKALFLTNLNSEIIYSKTISFNNNINAGDFVTVISHSVDEIIKSQKLDFQRILGLGLVMPGLIDPIKGTVMLSTEQDWKNVNLVHMVEKSTGLKTILEQDGNMQALGEYNYGVGSRDKNFVLITIEDDGIGSTLILNGELQRGNHNMSGEVGHITLDDNGPLCSCGKKGCIEAYIKAAVRKKTSNWKSEASLYIGKATSIIINLLDPKVVVLTGNVINKGGDELIEKIIEVTLENVLKAEDRDISINKSSVGSYIGIKGICGQIYDINFSEVKN